MKNVDVIAKNHLFLVAMSLLLPTITSAADSVESNSSTTFPPYNKQQQLQMAVAESLTGGTALLIQDVHPWQTNSIETVLDSWGIDYDIINSTSIAGATLEDYKFIIIASDQPQTFYDNYNAEKEKFATYLRNGGTLEFHAADQGWQSGRWYRLPGGITHEHHSDSSNTIYDDDFDSDNTATLRNKHPIVASMRTPFSGSSASHGHFSNLNVIRSNILIITRDGQNLPTTIEYSYGGGKGRVIATTNTIEFYYGRNSEMKSMLPNLIEYTALKSKMKLDFEGWGWSNPLTTDMYVSQVFLDPKYDLYFNDKAHLGIDIGASVNAPVFSICKGHVVGSPSSVVDDSKGAFLARLTVQCDTGNFAIVYGHITNPKVSLAEGTPVDENQQIAEVRAGASGNSHLHLGINVTGEVYFKGTTWGFGQSPATATFQQVMSHGWRDPVSYLRANNGP